MGYLGWINLRRRLSSPARTFPFMIGYLVGRCSLRHIHCIRWCYFSDSPRLDMHKIGARLFSILGLLRRLNTLLTLYLSLSNPVTLYCGVSKLIGRGVSSARQTPYGKRRQFMQFVGKELKL
jgi:hypothetical protein